MPENKIDTILKFWFEGVDDETSIDTSKPPFKKWFIKDKNVDEAIRQQFKADLVNASEGKYKIWEDTPKGRLALILLYDQFSRNIFRESQRMYAYDALALELTLRTINQRKDKELMLIQRAFLYLPLMHFEDVTLQGLSVKNFEQLVNDSNEKNPKNTHYYKYSLKHAREHYDTVAQFGRFPHRDAILQRIIK